MWERIIYNLRISLEAISQNRLRALLTSLGIVFGVSSVIAMLAIGSGAQQEIIEKLQVLGTNNIIVKRLTKEDKKQAQESSDEESETISSEDRSLQKKFSPDLSISDGQSIVDIIEYAEEFSYEVEIDSYVANSERRINTKVVGIDPNYFKNNSINISDGRPFSDIDHKKSFASLYFGAETCKISISS
jgi:putative ABC transport system permease protein